MSLLHVGVLDPPPSPCVSTLKPLVIPGGILDMIDDTKRSRSKIVYEVKGLFLSSNVEDLLTRPNSSVIIPKRYRTNAGIIHAQSYQYPQQSQQNVHYRPPSVSSGRKPRPYSSSIQRNLSTSIMSLFSCEVQGLLQSPFLNFLKACSMCRAVGSKIGILCSCFIEIDFSSTSAIDRGIVNSIF